MTKINLKQLNLFIVFSKEKISYLFKMVRSLLQVRNETKSPRENKLLITRQ